MNAQLFQRVKTIFLQACDQPEHERTEFLDRACNGDRELRFAVEDLLMNDEQPLDLTQSNHIRSRLSDLASSAAADDRQPESVALPTIIGRYRTLKRLGEGGMGVVYLAEQDSPRRSVALKIIATGRSSSQVLRRFEHEAQVLGRLQHPGIAQIFEAGTFDTPLGRQPYFAMEFVEGPSLLDFVQQQNMSVALCIDLFIKVCDGVAHAHQKGIIHRDLKPGNILVHSQAAVDQPKILDFGVARMTDSDVQTTTMHTGPGQLVGTVAYMSPEQVAGDVGVLDTRSDVYALGVILYQLLTGKFPYRVEGSMRDVMDAILTTEPSKPSSVSRLIDDEVETILLKCLSKELPRRYQSAGELAQDLRRYRAGEPIQAKRNSLSYVLRKSIARHRAATAVAAAFLLVIAAGFLVSLSAWRSAVHARDDKEIQRGIAVSEALKSQTVNGFLNEMLQSANPQVAQVREISVRETLDNAARLLEVGHLRDQPDVEATVRMTIGEAYLALAKYEQAEHHIQAALDIREKLHGHLHADTARSINLLGKLRYNQRDYAGSEALRREAISIFRAVNIGDHDDLADALMSLADTILNLGRMQEAALPAQESLAMRQRLHGEHDPIVAHAKADLAMIMHQPAQCAESLREALQTERDTLGPKDPRIPHTLIQLATIQHFSGDLDEAEQSYREALALNRDIYGVNHPEVILCVLNLGFLLESRGQLDRCAALYEEYRDAAAIAYGEKTVPYVQYLNGLADILFRTGHDGDSEQIMRQVLATLHEIGRDQDWNGSTARVALAVVLIAEKNFVEAEALARETLAIKETDVPANHWTRHQATTILGEVLTERRQYAEAEELLHKGYDGLIATRVPAEVRYYAAKRLADLYEAWDAAEPNTGKAEKAAHWHAIQAAESPPIRGN